MDERDVFLKEIIDNEMEFVINVEAHSSSEDFKRFSVLRMNKIGKIIERITDYYKEKK